MDTALILTGLGVIVAAIGVAATVIVWVLKSVFNLGGLHAKVDALTERVDALTERVNGLEGLHAKVDTLTERADDLSNKVDALAEGQRALQADLHQVINLLTALANHRHDVDGNTVFNLPSNPIPDRA